MSKLFKNHFEKFLSQSFSYSRSGPEFDIYMKLREFKKNHDINSGIIFYRFPKKEFRALVGIECPIESSDLAEEIRPEVIIKSGKKLRNFMGIREDLVCKSCSKRETCKFRDQIPKDNKVSVSDLITYMYGLYSYQNILNEKNDQIGKHFDNDEEKINVPNNNNQKTAKSDNTYNESKPEFKDRYSFRVYSSALKCTDTLRIIVDDAKTNKGISSRTFINAYIAESKKNANQQKDSEHKMPIDEYLKDDDNSSELKEQHSKEREVIESDQEEAYDDDDDDKSKINKKKSVKKLEKTPKKDQHHQKEQSTRHKKPEQKNYKDEQKYKKNTSLQNEVNKTDYTSKNKEKHNIAANYTEDVPKFQEIKNISKFIKKIP